MTRKLTARVEPAPIICHHQPDLAISQLQVEVERVGAGMFDRIVQRLLRHSVHRLLGRLGQVRLASNLHPDMESVAGLNGRSLLLQRAHQSLALQRLGSQLEDQRAQLRQAAFRQTEHVAHESMCLVGRRFEQLVGRGSIQQDAVQRLGDGVMQLARQPLPLLERRRAPHLRVQPRVLDGHRGLLGEHRRQFRVSGRVVPRGGVQQRLDTDHLFLDDERHRQLAVRRCWRDRHARGGEVLGNKRLATQILDQHGLASAANLVQNVAQGAPGLNAQTDHLFAGQRAAVVEHHRLVRCIVQDDRGGVVLDDGLELVQDQAKQWLQLQGRAGYQPRHLVQRHRLSLALPRLLSLLTEHGCELAGNQRRHHEDQQCQPFPRAGQRMRIRWVSKQRVVRHEHRHGGGQRRPAAVQRSREQNGNGVHS